MTKFDKDFKEWYYSKYANNLVAERGMSIQVFNVLPIEFRWGVLDKFFRENKIGLDSFFDEYTDREQAIDKAKEIYNSKEG